MVDESAIEPDPRIGSLVDDRYQVLEAMASGSMGVVYKAERVPVGKLVAIKFLHAPYAADAEFLARFERETRVMSKLTHPNCVSVVDFGVWDDAPYLVMEFVSGRTLRELIDDGALPPRRALALVRQIAAGLAHAHAQGIVHRDVKPANIMISEEIGTGDHVRILDFGLARLRGAVGRDATQANIVVGTPNYMAPEQTVGGGLIDARTDIYAVGVVLFEMICGERPFQADDTLALLGMHRAAPIPRLADRVQDVQVPCGLQDIIDKAMAKSPGDRFQSAIDLAEAIDRVSIGRPDGGDGESVIRAGTEARRVAGMAPTVLDLSHGAAPITPKPRDRSRGGFLGSLILLSILVGGAGAAVWWIKVGSAGREPTIPRSGHAALPVTVGADSKPGTTGASDQLASAVSGGTGSAAGAVAAPVAGLGSAPDRVGSASAVMAAPGSGEPSAPDQADASAAGAPPGSASGSALEPVGSNGQHTEAPTEEATDIEMDPVTAEDPAPASTKPSNDADEEANAPTTAEEVEKHTPAAPVLATTLHGAVRLIQEGKRDLAMASLRVLWKKIPASAYIPFLLGNIYYDRLWYTVALEHYAAAIKKNAQYKSNPTLNRNVIRMLASRISRKAQVFLKFTVGKPALPYLRYAAQHDPNGQVRRLSAWLARNI